MSRHRLSLPRLEAAVAVFALLIIGFFVPVSRSANAFTNPRRSVEAMPACMHRMTVTSNPCGATIYIDGIQVGRTPMSFPMPMGRYDLILLAPGHQQYSQRILVPDAPLEIHAKLVPYD
jgi:hypothetical protein